ncbi:hypothetical protein [Rhodococcus sp. MEB041]|uniref:hypothetical protein n=1 Tax=Rhodococcus sp. MEB041 TaxID=3040323 RepID=UPI00254F43E4|nr:hypothetical protein [Rhodococcus sp. MEB041]
MTITPTKFGSVTAQDRAANLQWWDGQPARLAARTAQFPSPKPERNLGVEAFTAFCECPACELWAYHWIRTPIVPSSWDHGHYATQYATWERKRALWLEAGNEEHVIQAFAGHTIRVYRPGLGAPPMPPRDESGAAVMRECRHCGVEWGQS